MVFQMLAFQMLADEAAMVEMRRMVGGMVVGSLLGQSLAQLGGKFVEFSALEPTCISEVCALEHQHALLEHQLAFAVPLQFPFGTQEILEFAYPIPPFHVGRWSLDGAVGFSWEVAGLHSASEVVGRDMVTSSSP